MLYLNKLEIYFNFFSILLIFYEKKTNKKKNYLHTHLLMNCIYVHMN